jgi:hypothetical protein
LVIGAIAMLVIAVFGDISERSDANLCLVGFTVLAWVAFLLGRGGRYFFAGR